MGKTRAGSIAREPAVEAVGGAEAIRKPTSPKDHRGRNPFGASRLNS